MRSEDTAPFLQRVTQRVAFQPEEIRPRPHPIKPLGGPFRRWHLTPWKRTEATALLDDLGGLQADGDGTDGWDVLNTLVGQAGQIYGASQGMVVARPAYGQMVPRGSTVPLSSSLGMSQNTLLLLGLGAAALGFFLMKRK